jgi:RecA-family ATPase
LTADAAVVEATEDHVEALVGDYTPAQRPAKLQRALVKATTQTNVSAATLDALKREVDLAHEAARRADLNLPPRSPLDWNALATSTPSARDWIVDHWFPANEVTLLAGPGGIGKTGVAQALGSCVALHREYLDWVPRPRKVLMWACEDDHDELWRRQAAIARQLGVSLTDFAGKFFLESFHRTQVELAALVHGNLADAHDERAARADRRLQS